jgi:hypothetical protein
MIDDSCEGYEAEFIFFVAGIDKRDGLSQLNSLFGKVYLSHDEALSSCDVGDKVYSISVFVNADHMEIVNEL